ncbi:MAG: hypothetical protein AAB668_01630 [Patescibacteria group bacterium]
MRTTRRSKLEAGDINRGLKQAKSTKRRVVFTILALGTIFGWTYLVFISDAFSVSAVEVRGVEDLDPVDVTKEVFHLLDAREEFRPWPPRHAWFIDREALQEKLKSRLFVLNATVENSYNNVLRLSVEERVKRVVFHSHKQYFWLDHQGVATQELSDEEKRDTQARLLGHRSVRSEEPPVIKRDLDELVAPGFVLTNQNEAREWIALSEKLGTAGLAYRELEPPTASSSLFKVLSVEGYTVLMDITSPIESQVHTYQAFIKNKPKDLGQPEYIDVRVPGRVYLK